MQIRQLLGLKPKDKVVFSVDSGEVKPTAARETLEPVMGSVEPPSPTEAFKQLSREAKEAHVAKSAAKLAQQEEG